jgi:thiosulfate dehydrogenase [quinone] large subunit
MNASVSSSNETSREFASLAGPVLAVQRILVGLLLLSTTVENFNKGLYGAGYAEFLAGWAQGTAIGPYRVFLEQVIIPNASFWAGLQLIFEPLIGLLLVLGLFTRLAALAGSLFALNLLLAAFGNDWIWTYVMLLALIVSVGLTGAGRLWGLDGLLARRLPATIQPALRIVS